MLAPGLWQPPYLTSRFHLGWRLGLGSGPALRSWSTNGIRKGSRAGSGFGIRIWISHSGTGLGWWACCCISSSGTQYLPSNNYKEVSGSDPWTLCKVLEARCVLIPEQTPAPAKALASEAVAPRPCLELPAAIAALVIRVLMSVWLILINMNCYYHDVIFSELDSTRQNHAPLSPYVVSPLHH